MIALLKGAVIRKYADYVIIETSGVGYRVFLPSSSINELGLGEIKEIFTYLHVREDAMLLYGFLLENEKEIFVKLLSISGLGPKTALAVIAHLSADSFLNAVQQSDSEALAKVPGIGKKTAQRIILELKGKIDFAEEGKLNQSDEVFTIAMEALSGLGYSKVDIKNVLLRIDRDIKVPEDIIRQALKLLAKV